MAYSNGPWRVEIQDGEIWGIYAANGDRIVETDTGIYPPHTDDANLIAAAPELLEALKLAREQIESANEPYTTLLSNTIRKAIAKAEGGLSGNLIKPLSGLQESSR